MEGDRIILDGKEIGRCATKYINSTQIGKRSAQGRRDLSLIHIMNKNDKMLNEIASGTRDAATGLNKLEEAAKDAGDSLEDIGKKLDAGNLMEAADTLSGAGDKIIEAGQKMTDSFASLEGTTTKVNGYFGLTGEAAEQMGSVVENVFKSGVTDSLESVGDAVITVNNNLKDLDPSQLETLTTQAMTMEEIFGSDMNETMRGVNALMVNFGMDAQEAMDYLIKGSQNGLDKTQELGDNLEMCIRDRSIVDVWKDRRSKYSTSYLSSG